MFNSITNAISSFFKPKGTTTSTAPSPFARTSTSPNPLNRTSTAPSPLKPLPSNIATAPSPFKTPTPAKPTNVLAGITAGGSSKVPAIQNQVLSSPVTVGQMSEPPIIAPPVLGSTTGNTFSGLDTSSKEAPTPVSSGREDILSRVLKLTEKTATQADRQAVLDKEYSLQEKQDALNSLNAKALTVDREYELKRRAIMENPEGKTTSGLAGEIKNLERAKDQQLADIGIQQAVAQGNVNLVKDNVKRRIDAEFEPIKTQIEGLKNYMTLYSDDLTEKEKALLDGEIKKQEIDYTANVKNAEAQQSASAYQALLDKGSITLKDIPQAIVPYMNTSTVNRYTQEMVTPIREKLTLLGGLIDKVDNSGAVGTNPLARTSLTSWATGARQDFVGGVKQLTSQETLNALLELKKAGGTLGALSDGERFMLQESASKIGAWEMKDGKGQGTGFYNVSEKSFKEELVRLQTLAEKAMLNADVVPLAEKAQIIANTINRNNPTWSEETKKEALRIKLKEYSPQESFNAVGNTTVSIPKQSKLAFVNNNPANLRFAGQAGATQGQGGFARFATPEAGYQALQNQIKLDASRGLTLAQFINKFAPPTENDTQTYINQVRQMTGATSSTLISQIDLSILSKAIARKESSTNIA